MKTKAFSDPDSARGAVDGWSLLRNEYMDMWALVDIQSWPSIYNSALANNLPFYFTDGEIFNLELDGERSSCRS